MKSFFLVASLSMFFSISFAAPANPGAVKPYDLMKCTSAKHGTLWASFGHLMRSGQTKLQYFPTEIVIFNAKAEGARLLFPVLQDAFKIPVSVENGRIRMEFKIQMNGVEQTHLLQLFQYRPELRNSFLGTWSVTEGGAPVMNDLGCTVN